MSVMAPMASNGYNIIRHPGYDLEPAYEGRVIPIRTSSTGEGAQAFAGEGRGLQVGHIVPRKVGPDNLIDAPICESLDSIAVPEFGLSLLG